LIDGSIDVFIMDEVHDLISQMIMQKILKKLAEGIYVKKLLNYDI
jgi:hypothetical protein